jgi:signal transduction histidine kinase
MALTIGSVAAALLILGGAGIYLSLRQVLTAHFDTGLFAKADALISASEVDDGEFELDAEILSFAGFGTKAPGVYFEIRSEDGRVLARSASLGAGDLDQGSVVGSAVDIVLPDDHEGRAVSATFTPKDAETPEFQNLRIIVASDVRVLRDTLRSIATVLLVSGLAGWVISLVALQIVLALGLRPLVRLAREVQDIDLEGSRRRVATTHLPAELAPVAGKLNALLERVEATFARERRFTSHASHELRTPLAELKTMTELGLRWPDEMTPEHVQGMLDVISELEALLDALAVLAKADAKSGVQREPVDMARTLEACLQRFQATISSRQLTVETAAGGGVVSTDPAFWNAILMNVVGNAVQYAPERSSVMVEASAAGLKVANDAPLLSPEDIPQLQERFWRKAQGALQEKHYGLGLSIVQACAEALGGSCRISLDGKKLTVEVRLP